MPHPETPLQTRVAVLGAQQDAESVRELERRCRALCGAQSMAELERVCRVLVEKTGEHKSENKNRLRPLERHRHPTPPPDS